MGFGRVFGQRTARRAVARVFWGGGVPRGEEKRRLGAGRSVVVTAFFGGMIALAVASCCFATGTESPGHPRV